MKHLVSIALVGVLFGCTPTAGVVVADDNIQANNQYTIDLASGNSNICAAVVAPGPRKVGNPYTVAGQTYYPVSSADGYMEEGVASWYGPGFNGKLTANGEIYNQQAMTAAHKTLPMPTYVVVENLENGKSVVVRVNDRGPFSKGRIIDLSEKAAQELDMIDKGTAKVRVSVLSEDPNCVVVKGQEVSIDKGDFAVQIGAFSDPDNAERLANEYGERGHIATSVINDTFVYRVWVTGYTSRQEAMQAAEELSSQYSGAYVIAR